MIKRFFLLLAVVVALASCASQREISYFQNVKPDAEFEYAKGHDITIKEDDMLSIIVSSKNPELASMFNLPKIQQIAGASSSSNGGGSTELSGYIVNSNGTIDFPVLGEIHIAGQTREEIAQTVKSKLISGRLVNDPVVTVSFLNLQYYVLGEVAAPGSYSINKNKTTIIEALSSAGDLTIYGQRDKVFLTRNVNNNKVTYQIDLRTQDIYTSPAFYIQQNDVIYVEPNRVRANQSTINGNTLSSVPFWMSLASFLTTMTLLFVK
ncbi:MAG: polysaccharide biosynthesis/export family protein [Rikenellaceae bacterium]